MPEVQHSVEFHAGVDEIWRYVENIDNWAPFVIGFQRVQIIDEAL